MRDANLIFHDGTNFTATVTPVSTTRSGGSAVLDLGKTGGMDLWAEAVLAVAIVGASGTIDVKFQASDSPTFASGIEDLGAIPQLNNTTTVVPYRRSIKIMTKRRYVRAALTTGGTVTTETLYVHLQSGPQRDDVA
jgi:hypothetical protein